jgi:hypothetical protein
MMAVAREESQSGTPADDAVAVAVALAVAVAAVVGGGDEDVVVFLVVVVAVVVDVEMFAVDSSVSATWSQDEPGMTG